MLNSIVLIGRLTADPDLRYLPNNGSAVATFKLAVARQFKKDETDFIPIVTWQKQAENCANYLKKGSQCAVQGRLQTRNYENKEGRKVYVTEIVADRVEFLDPKGKSDKPAGGWDDLGHEIETDDDETPF